MLSSSFVEFLGAGLLSSIFFYTDLFSVGFDTSSFKIILSITFLDLGAGGDSDPSSYSSI